MFFVFFFKTKSAYEMRISDWSSDVCSSDLSKDSGTVVSGPLNEVFRDLIQWLSTQELKKRIDICIGRDEKTVTNRIMGTAINKEIEAEEVFDAVADMMERVDAGESLMTEESGRA